MEQEDVAAMGGNDVGTGKKGSRVRIRRLGLFKAGAAALVGALGAGVAGSFGARNVDAAATTGVNFAAYGTDTTYTGQDDIGFDASDTNAGFATGVSGYGKLVGALGVVGDLGKGTLAAGILGLGESGHLPGGVPFKAGTGVFALAAKGGVAVDAYGSGGIGVHGTTKSPDHSGVLGQNNADGPGVHGISMSGVGGVFEGGEAAVRLIPSASASHPRSGHTGDLMLDASHRLWFCKRGGSPAVWKRLA
jgi:hypothetical protein